MTVLAERAVVDDQDRGGAAAAAPAVDPDRGTAGVVLAALLALGACAGSALGLTPVVLLAYPAAALLVALTLLFRGRTSSYLVLVVVLWLVSHEVRRVVDWQSVYHPFSPITTAGPLVSLAGLPFALAARRAVQRDVRTLMTVALVVLGYGLAVGVVRNGAVPAVADLLTLAGPVATGLWVLAVPQDDARLRSVLRSTALWALALLGTYTVVQFLVLPAWDQAWLVESGVGSLGRPFPGEFRAFGTLSTTGPLGQTLAVLLLLAVAERRSRLQVPAMVVGLVGLGVTLVRAGWIGTVLGIAVMLYLGRARAGRLVAIVAVLLVGLVLVGGPIYTAISTRAAETATEGTQDQSLQARLAFQAQVAPQTLSDPVGDGMGSTGLATDLSVDQQSSSSDFRTFDSGLFETLTRYGVLAGGALLVSLSTAVVCIVRRARHGTVFDAACAAAIVALSVNLVFTDTARAVYGVLLWTLIGLQGRPWTWPRGEEPALPATAGTTGTAGTG